MTKKILDTNRCGNAKYNLIEQFNIKIGGENYHIDFVDQKIMKSVDVLFIIGLSCQKNTKDGKIKYSMTPSKSLYLNLINISVKECDNKKDEKYNFKFSMIQ